MAYLTYSPTENERYNTELGVQISVAQWLKAFYPELLFFHVPNEGKRKRDASTLIQSGVLSGVSDIIILTPKGKYHGAVIEIKRNDKKAVASKTQKEFLTKANNSGYFSALTYGITSTKKAILDYINC